MGVINWFPLHCTSMNNSNQLISGDHKGLASQLLEKHVNSKSQLSGTVSKFILEMKKKSLILYIISLQGPFVAAFASSNSGDVSPNINGPKCKDTGMDCDFSNSTCGGSSQNCLAFGPGTDMKDSTYIVGKRQFQEAKV